MEVNHHCNVFLRTKDEEEEILLGFNTLIAIYTKVTIAVAKPAWFAELQKSMRQSREYRGICRNQRQELRRKTILGKPRDN